ncbi:unnamed protein product, partial [Mesorhabditis belari]|uniref:BED-type domain-containing protein n=1 Tax=Mesorhabditis belari TaxID=2138241 RepID=A0AAF3FMH5_9BILA
MLPGGAFPPLFSAALMQQFPTLQQFQSQLACLQQQSGSPLTPLRKTRVGGSSVKTAKVWKYFDQLPVEEQAAECQLCRKKIKATNSSTTGMIRHLRSCHVAEYQLLQEARQTGIPCKFEEKRMSSVKDGHPAVVVGTPTSIVHQQKSPSSLSSASDTTSSISTTASPPFHSLSTLASTVSPLVPPLGLPAPKAIIPNAAKRVEQLTEAEEEEEATDLRTKSSTPSNGPTAFSIVRSTFPETSKSESIYVNSSLDSVKLHTQVAMMILLDGQPANIVDRPGFRGLLRLLLPMHTLPSSDRFDSDIIPSTLTQLRHELAQQFLINNPHSPLATLAGLSALHHNATPLDMTIKEEPIAKDENPESPENEEEPIRVEEDSDSASSADSERVDESSKVHRKSINVKAEMRSTSSASGEPWVLSTLQRCRALSLVFHSVGLSNIFSSTASI